MLPVALYCFFFFFQAEDGIRDYKVTGVQTCALPICGDGRARLRTAGDGGGAGPRRRPRAAQSFRPGAAPAANRRTVIAPPLPHSPLVAPADRQLRGPRRAGAPRRAAGAAVGPLAGTRAREPRRLRHG